MGEMSPEELARLEKATRGPDIIAIVSSFTAIAMIAVSLRLFTRLKITKMFGPEDTFIVLAMASSIAMAGLQIRGAEWGTGRHQLFLDATSLEWVMICLYCSIPTYNIGLFFVRISILLQYRRIFVAYQGVWAANSVAMGICVAQVLQSVFVGLFQCIPIDGFWDLEKMPTSKCIDVNAWYYANAGLNVAIDLLIAALPVRAIWCLRIPVRQKVAVHLILTMGWFICIISIVRLHSLIGLGNNPQDASWYGAAPAYYSAVEVNLAIVCASLPALKPLLAKLVPDFPVRQLSNRSRFTRTATFDHQASMLSGDSNRWYATIESHPEHGFNDDSTPSSPLPPNQIFVMRKFERHSAIDMDFEQTERSN